LNLDTNAQATSDVTVALKPSGLAINQATGIALIANTGSNTVSSIDLNPLLASPLEPFPPPRLLSIRVPLLSRLIRIAAPITSAWQW